MKQVRVRFEMTSLDVNSAFTVNGLFESNQLTFIDPEQNTHTLLFEHKSLTYIRKGEMMMHYLYQEGRITTGTYQLEGISYTFQIHTNTLLVTDDLIHIQFELYQSNDLINRMDLQLSLYQMKEEHNEKH